MDGMRLEREETRRGGASALSAGWVGNEVMTVGKH